jgi:hypothetical protein
MKPLIKTLAILVALNLALLTPNLAQDASKEQEKTAGQAQAAAMKAQAEAQKQAELAQKQAEAAVKQAQANALAAQAAIKNAAKNVDARLLSLKLAGAMSTTGAGPVLVIPAAQMNPEDLAAITEDTNIMARIFEKKLQQAHIPSLGGSFLTSLLHTARNVPHRLFAWSSQTIESIYLDGFGVIFLMQVDFPLSPSPQAPEPNQPQEDTDPLWSQTKRQIYTPDEYEREREPSPEKEYDAEKVQDLQRTLIETLQHAANIRNLQPDHSVILVVRGYMSDQNMVITRTITQKSDTEKSKVVALGASSAAEGGPSTAAVLIIRAKKSDIDAFSKGGLDYDQFRERCELITY